MNAQERLTERQIDLDTQLGKWCEMGITGLSLVRAKHAYTRFRDSPQTAKDLAVFDEAMRNLDKEAKQ